jgi:hypothetical protein
MAAASSGAYCWQMNARRFIPGKTQARDCGIEREAATRFSPIGQAELSDHRSHLRDAKVQKPEGQRRAT